MSEQSESEVEHVSIMEYNENAADHGRTPGDRVIVGGHRRNTNVRCDEKKGFVEIAEAVAIIELHQPIDQDEVTDWCNSEAGKLALSHWFDVTEPEEVICAGRDAEKRLATDGGQPEAALEQFEADTDPYDLRDALGDSWGEKVLVRVVDGSDGEYYAAAGEDSPINIRIAWMEYYDEPVWVHRNRPGYELKSSSDSTSWEIRAWEDTPVKTDWEVLFP